MATSQSDVSSNIIAALRVSDPDLDTSVGTTTRKIIDAVSESIAEAYVDQYVQSYAYDIDSKIGGDLDDFVQTFGISRLPAKRATGAVTFTKSGSFVWPSQPTTIPLGTTIQTTTGVVFTTLSAITIESGITTGSAPIQASGGGTQGNVAPSTVTVWPNGILNMLVTNPLAVTGGTDAETDAELRLRWKRTVFRSLAGTEQMYLGVALDDDNCTAAHVLSAQERRSEQLQIVTGAATSTLTSASYVFASGVFVQADDGTNLVAGLDYTWATTIPPVMTLTPAGALKAPNGTLVTLEFDYTSVGSRNDPTTGLMNRVDMWCVGSRSQSATQSVVFRNTLTFNTTGGSPYNRTKWARLDGSLPTSGNVFIPLAFGPIIGVPDTISVAAQTYGLVGSGLPGLDFPDAFRIVHEDSAFGYSGRSLFGLEWDNAQKPANNSTFTLDYTYNEVPSSIQVEVDRWRLAGVDVMVHAAKTLLFKFNVAIIYTAGSTQSVVNEDIDAAVSKWLSSLSFSDPLQGSDALAVIHSVSGVDSVRFLNGSDHSGYVSGTPNIYTVGIQRVVDGAVVQSYVDVNGRVTDVILGDRESAALSSVYKVPKAQNSFGSL